MCIQCSNSEQDLSIWQRHNLDFCPPNVGHIWRLAKHLAWLFIAKFGFLFGFFRLLKCGFALLKMVDDKILKLFELK
jgi:hypothetical protein